MKFLSYSIFLANLFLPFSLYSAKFIQLNDKNLHNYFVIKKQTLQSLNGDYTFKLARTLKLSSGLKKSLYSLYYQGVPVYGIKLTNSEISNQKKNWRGTTVINIEDDLKSIKPKYTEKTVLQMAKKHFKPKKADKIINPKVMLTIRINQNGKAELIYLVSFNVEGPRVQRPFYMISATKGNLIQSWDALAT